MQRSESTVINRPSEDLWALVGDVRRWPKWLRGVSDVRLLSEEVAVGSEFAYKWRDRDVSATVSAYKRGQTIGISSSEKNYDFQESITLEPLGDQTKVELTMGFEPTVWWATALSVLVVPFKGPLLGRPLRKELESLRTAAESEPSPPEERPST